MSFSCKVSDERSLKMPLENLTETGFISPEFFQTVVSVPHSRKELSIKDLRTDCKKRSVRLRDQLTLQILVRTRAERFEQESTRGFGYAYSATRLNDGTQPVGTSIPNTSSSVAIAPSVGDITYGDPGDIWESNLLNRNTSNYTSHLDSFENDPRLNKGAFSWFLDSMSLFSEDYSKKSECIFVYRLIQKNLRNKVELTKLDTYHDKESHRKRPSDE